MRTKELLAGASLTAFFLAGCWEGPFTDMRVGLTGVEQCSLAWGDYDNDGDLDLALAGQSSDVDPYDPVTAIYQNSSGSFAPIGASLEGARYASLAWCDYDADGDLDLATVGSVDRDVYENTGGGAFSGTNAWSWLHFGSLACGDYDNDGDPDVVLSGWCPASSTLSNIYENTGGSFAGTSPGLSAVDACSLAWGDCDNDGDLDLALAGKKDGSIPVAELYRNDGSGALNAPFSMAPGVMGCSVAWGDYDSDGDLDIALAGATSETPLNSICGIYGNDGAGSFTEIGAGLPDVWSCSLAWGDYDNDGDLDLAVAGATGDLASPNPTSRIYRNDGGAVFADIGAGLTGVFGCSLAWGDYDNDGDLDLALAGKDGADRLVSKVYRNNTWCRDTRPSAPTVLSATPGSGQATFSWNPATDAETPAPGLTYNLRVGTDTNQDDVMPAHAFVGGVNDGKRLIPAMGNVQHNTSWTLTLPSGTYYWSIQAVDTAFCGSPWAPEQTVTVP